MVTSPSGKGAILVGCNESQESFYELKSDNGQLKWEKMKQKLQYPRSHTIAIKIPDSLVQRCIQRLNFIRILR